MANYRNNNLDKYLKATKALSDKSRVRLLMCLAEGELCVCQINELFELAPSTISKHLSILKEAGLIESRKEGRWIHYRVCQDADEAVEGILKMSKKCLKNDEKIGKDKQKLQKIMKINKEKLCKKNRS